MKLKIVMDTNVLISGTFWAGSSSKMIKLIEKKELILLTSPEIIKEYDDVINYKEIKEKIHYDQERAEAVQKVILLGIITNPKENFDVIKEDQSDNKFLEVAVAGNADYLITRDKKHILPLKEFGGIKIVTPEKFLEILNERYSLKDPLKKDRDNEADERWNDL